MPQDRHPLAGGLLIAAGVIGVVTGVVPLTVNALRIALGQTWWNNADLASHGVERMGLSVEWGMLSSGMGLFLGILLLWAGRAWRAGRPSAALLSWVYVLGGLIVNAIDMFIFALRAVPGPMRSQMLLLDGLATLLPVALAFWLIRRKNGR